MAEKDLAIQFKRQYSEAIEADYNFTTSERNDYLTNPLRYSGQIVFDSDQDKLYRLNGARTTWIEVVSGGSGHVIKDSTNTAFTQRNALKFIGATVTDNAVNGSTDITINAGVTSVNGHTGSVTLVTDDIMEDGSPVNLWFSTSRVLSTLLSGLSTATSSAITTVDSILDAFGKLQAQINTLLGRVQNSMAVDGTGNKIPTVDAVNIEVNNLARATTNIGLVDAMLDTFNVARTDDTHLNVTGTSVGVIFPTYFDTPPFAPSTAIRQIPTNTNYPLSSLTGTLPAVGTQGVYFLGWRDSTQVFEVATTSYVQNPNVFQCGVVFLKNVGGVISFIDSVRHVIPVPDISQYSNLETTAIGVTSNILIKANSGGMTVRNLAGSITGLSVNYKGTNNDDKPITATNPISFLRLNPGNATSVILPAMTSTVVTTDYWNGSAMVALSANGKASIQRWLISIRGGFILQTGEAEYNTLDDAIASMDVATFADIIPKGTFVELARMAATKDCTDLTILTKARFTITGKGGGGGSGASSTPFVNVTGSPYDNVALSAELQRITTDITPTQKALLSNNANWSTPTSTTVSTYTGSTPLSGNLQCQFYFDGLYFYYFVADDFPVRMIGNLNGVLAVAGTFPLTALDTTTQNKIGVGNLDYVTLTTNPDTKTTSDWIDIKGKVASVTEDRESIFDNTSITAGSFTYDYRVSTSASPTTGVSFATLATALVNTTDATKSVWVRAINTTSTVAAAARLNITRI